MKGHQEYMNLIRKEKYPIGLTAFLYPMSVMAGMTIGVGIATYTPFFFGRCCFVLERCL